MGIQPAAVTEIGNTTKEGSAMIALSSGVKNVLTAISISSFEPLPRTISSKVTLCFSDYNNFRKYPLPSGYLLIPFKCFFISSIADGEGPKGFSLEANLTESFMPSSLSSSSIGLPGTYGFMLST